MGSLWLILVAGSVSSKWSLTFEPNLWLHVFVFELHQCHASSGVGFIQRSHTLHSSPLLLFITLVWFNCPSRPSGAFGRTYYVVGTWLLVDDFNKWRKRKNICANVNLPCKFISDGTSQIHAPSPILSEAHAAVARILHMTVVNGGVS